MSIRIRLPRTRRFRRLAVTALVAAGLTLTGAAPAMAYTPVNIVHTERVQAVVYAHRHGLLTTSVEGESGSSSKG
jgi:hypothetical protein